MKDATRLNVMRKSRVEREETLLRRRHEMQEENLKRQVQILLRLNSKRNVFSAFSCYLVAGHESAASKGPQR